MKLKKWLRVNNIYFPDFANNTNIHLASIYNYINDRRTPTLDVAIRIVEYTEGAVSYQELLRPGEYKKCVFEDDGL